MFFFSSRRRHTRFDCDWSSDVCSSDLHGELGAGDDGIPPTMGALRRSDGIATRLCRDSEGARIEAGNAREKDYAEALGVFYDGWEQRSHAARAMAYRDAMRGVHERNPKD